MRSTQHPARSRFSSSCSGAVTANDHLYFTSIHALTYRHVTDPLVGIHWSGDRSPFDRFADAETATSASARARSFAYLRFLAVSHAAPPLRCAFASGTMWSTSSCAG